MHNKEWDRDEHLFQLTKGIETSVSTSLKYLGAEFPPGTLRLKHTFITQKVIDQCSKRFSNRDETYGENGPKLSVDIYPDNSVEISLYALYEDKQFLNIDRWNLNEASDHQKSVEDFFGYIAEKCYKLVHLHHKKYETSGRVNVDCGLIFRHPVNQLSLTDSMLTTWNLHLAETTCEVKDLARMFDDALKLHEDTYFSMISCTHVINDCVSALAGMHIRYSENKPDIMVTVNQGQNICFFYGQHKVPGFECQNMIVNSEISHLGDFIGSCDHQLLCKFLTPIEDVLKTIRKNEKYLLPKFINGYYLSETIRTFINLQWPELKETFTWLKEKSSITEADISNFLESNETKKSLPSKLCAIIAKIEPHKQRDLPDIVNVLVKRSASLMAAITLGFARALAYANRPTKKVTVGLDGSIMLGMFGYKKQFQQAMQSSQECAAKSSDFEQLKLEILFTDAKPSDLDASNVMLAEYISDCAGY